MKNKIRERRNSELQTRTAFEIMDRKAAKDTLVKLNVEAKASPREVNRQAKWNNPGGINYSVLSFRQDLEETDDRSPNELQQSVVGLKLYPQTNMQYIISPKHSGRALYNLSGLNSKITLAESEE